MDATAWVGVAGIAGTLTAGVLTSFVTERMRRVGARRDQLLSQRLAAYADLLRVSGRLAYNATTWGVHPTAEDVTEIDNDELDRVVSRARVVASEDVFRCLAQLESSLGAFNRQLMLNVRPAMKSLREGDGSQLAGLSKARDELAQLADRVVAAHRDLESRIRRDTSA